MRLDKYLCEAGVGSRSQVKIYIKKGQVTINEERAKKPEEKVDETKDIIKVNGEVVEYEEYEYFLLNKPQGVVSATRDKISDTVIQLITDRKRNDLFPVGRLDKDTEGLLLITNDGALAHDLLSPKKHVDKTYYAKIEGMVTKEDIKLFLEGVDIGDDKPTLPARLTIIQSGEVSEIELSIQEGRYHQVKRMFEAVGKKVIYLKRIQMGELKLDESLKPGEYKRLTKEEIHIVRRVPC